MERAVAANFSDWAPLCSLADARAEKKHACLPSLLPLSLPVIPYRTAFTIGLEQ